MKKSGLILLIVLLVLSFSAAAALSGGRLTTVAPAPVQRVTTINTTTTTVVAPVAQRTLVDEEEDQDGYVEEAKEPVRQVVQTVNATIQTASRVVQNASNTSRISSSLGTLKSKLPNATKANVSKVRQETIEAAESSQSNISAVNVTELIYNISKEIYAQRKFKTPINKSITVSTSNVGMRFNGTEQIIAADVEQKWSLFGVIPITINKHVEVDTKGRVVTEKKPWYSFLGKEKGTASADVLSNIDYPVAFNNDVGAELEVCNLEGSCSGDMGSTHWAKEASIAADAKNKKRKLSFTVSSKDITKGLLQISLTPFNNAWPVEDAYTKTVDVGYFDVDFDEVMQKQGVLKPAESTQYKLSVAKTFFEEKKNTTLSSLAATQFNSQLLKVYPKYYLRIVPLNGEKIAGAPTNEISVEIVEPQNNTIKIEKFTAPKIYTVKIKQFQPVLAPDVGACSHRMVLDTDYDYLNIHIADKGDYICPESYKGVGEAAWYEQLWDALKSGLAWVSEAYSKIKEAMVLSMAAFSCGNNAVCKAAIGSGLDIGLITMGIPPSIPDFDALLDEGTAYLAAEIATVAGCPDPVCMKLTADAFKAAKAAVKNLNPACMDAGTAHEMGIEPVCLPQGVTAHWDPQATYRDAKVVLEITRNNLPEPTNPYTLSLVSYAHNAGPVGGSIVNIEPYGKTVKIEEPLEGELFDYKYITIPKMVPGSTMDIPINLVASEYWVPGHKEAMGGWTTVVYKDGWPQYQYNDWWMLYYGADMQMQVSIDGCQPMQHAGYNDCIVSHDEYSRALPMGLHDN